MGYSPGGHKELDTTERLTHTHTHTYRALLKPKIIKSCPPLEKK